MVQCDRKSDHEKQSNNFFQFQIDWMNNIINQWTTLIKYGVTVHLAIFFKLNTKNGMKWEQNSMGTAPICIWTSLAVLNWLFEIQ